MIKRTAHGTVALRSTLERISEHAVCLEADLFLAIVEMPSCESPVKLNGTTVTVLRSEQSRLMSVTLSVTTWTKSSTE